MPEPTDYSRPNARGRSPSPLDRPIPPIRTGSFRTNAQNIYNPRPIIPFVRELNAIEPRPAHETQSSPNQLQGLLQETRDLLNETVYKVRQVERLLRIIHYNLIPSQNTGNGSD